MTGPALILGAIERQGWQIAAAGDGWQISRAAGPTAYLSLTRSWACFQAPLDPSFESVADDAARAAQYERLLCRNETMFLARYGLDPQGVPLLSVEVPLSGGLRLVNHALAALARYWDAPDPAGPLARPCHHDGPPGIPQAVMAYYLRAVQAWGWGLRARPRGVTWPLVYKGQRLFEGYLTVTQSWSYFHIPALLRVPVAETGADPAARRAWLAYLLGVNDAWYMAKLGVDENERVMLMLEVPTPALDFDLFRQLTRLLGAYLDLYARELQIMANLPADRALLDLLATRVPL